MEYRLPRGQSLKLRYRFIFHSGLAKDAKIGQRFTEYAKDNADIQFRLCPTTQDILKTTFPKIRNKPEPTI